MKRLTLLIVILFNITPIFAGSPGNYVCGTVVDEQGLAIIGANVLVMGTVTGTITDIDGKFILEAKGNDILEISYIGFRTERIPIQGRTEFHITLKEDSWMLLSAKEQKNVINNHIDTMYELTKDDLKYKNTLFQYDASLKKVIFVPKNQ